MRRRWPEHCCPERHREDAAAQRALRGPSDASTHRNAAAGISQLSYSAHVVSYLDFSSARFPGTPRRARRPTHSGSRRHLFLCSFLRFTNGP
jgi:hypothetical protein